MKNLLLLLTVFAFTFSSCSSSDDSTPEIIITPDSDPSPYEGTWSGTYSGDFAGTWSTSISSTGTTSSWFLQTGTNDRVTGNGIVTDTGIVSETHANGGTSLAEINGTTITGTWRLDTFSGTYSGSKE